MTMYNLTYNGINHGQDGQRIAAGAGFHRLQG